jgi:hypothetical protein
MKMKRAEDDVWLSNGEAYMVENVKYNEHLKASLDGREVRIRISFFYYLANIAFRDRLARTIGQSIKQTLCIKILKQLE